MDLDPKLFGGCPKEEGNCQRVDAVYDLGDGKDTFVCHRHGTRWTDHEVIQITGQPCFAIKEVAGERVRAYEEIEPLIAGTRLTQEQLLKEWETVHEQAPVPDPPKPRVLPTF